MTSAAGTHGRVLIVSASMGGGHDGVARELSRRLVARGVETTVVDFLDAFPMRVGHALKRLYRLQLTKLSWSYDLSYWTIDRLPGSSGPLGVAVSAATSGWFRKVLDGARPDVIVSTYPFSSIVLGRGRLAGWVRAPLVTYVTDFAAHPLWTHRGVDLHLCVHELSAGRAATASGRLAVAPGPLVPPAFGGVGVTKTEARRHLGLPEHGRLALVVAGSWGLGNVGKTFEAVRRAGRYVPVVVCGTNESLRRDLSDMGGEGIVLGWTDDMPRLMAACDVLVQNGGGLSCMEAFAAGLPVVTYRPVAGHGRQNGADMARAGVAELVRRGEDLDQKLDLVTSPAGQAQVSAGRALFREDPSRWIMRLLEDPTRILTEVGG